MKNLFIDIKDELQKQLKDMYLQGVKQGSISTCATIYATFIAVGLEEDNLLFTILKDLAATNGCTDLPAYVKKLKEKKDTSKEQYLC